MSVVVIFAEAKQARERRHNEQIGSGTYEGGAGEGVVVRYVVIFFRIRMNE